MTTRDNRPRDGMSSPLLSGECFFFLLLGVDDVHLLNVPLTISVLHSLFLIITSSLLTWISSMSKPPSSATAARLLACSTWVG